MIAGLISNGAFCEEQEQVHTSLDWKRMQRREGLAEAPDVILP